MGEEDVDSIQALDTQLCFALYSTMLAVSRTYAPLLERLRLTYPQYLVMLVLWERDDMSVKAIGDRLFLDSGTLTPLLKRLEAAGLLRRRRNPDDERQVRVRLTQHGQGMREDARSVPTSMACAMARPVERLGALRDDLLKLRSTLFAVLDDERGRVASNASLNGRRSRTDPAHPSHALASPRRNEMKEE